MIVTRSNGRHSYLNGVTTDRLQHADAVRLYTVILNSGQVALHQASPFAASYGADGPR